MSDQPEPPGPNPYQQDNPYQPQEQAPDQPAPPPYGTPQYGAPQYGTPQYGTPPPYGQPQYEQPQYEQPQYEQPQYEQPAYGQQYQQQYQQPYQQPGQYPQPGYSYAAPVPNHPSANTAMVLGIVALAGIVACGGITLVLSPFAWIIGAKAVREIDASPSTYGGRGSAQAGKIMGIIGTVLLILGVLFFAFIIGLAVVSDGSSSSVTYDSTS